MDLHDIDGTSALGEPGRFSQLSGRYDPERRVVWMVMGARPRPSFNRELLTEIRELSRLVRSSGLPVDFWVTASSVPGVFNTGGDLDLFAHALRRGEHDTLRAYARSCVDCIDEAMHGFGTGALSLALVQGDALGGGFECALAHNFVIAEESARLGFPEVKFNLFPGMGAYPLVAQRSDAATAEHLISAGTLHPAPWHAERNLVDEVVAPGTGVAGVLAFLDGAAPRLNALRALVRSRHRVRPVPKSLLMEITEDWAEAAFAVGPAGLAYMERLVALQNRKFVPGAAEAPVLGAGGSGAAAERLTPAP